MTTTEALHMFGVRDDTLTDDEKATLDRDGFLVLHNILSEAQLAAIATRLEELTALEGENAGSEVGQSEAGVLRLSNLVDKGDVFDVFTTQPRVLAGIARVLQNDMKLSSLNFRASLPGGGQQALHMDSGTTASDGNFEVCNSIWLLDDFTEMNGATRLVPGTHRSDKMPQEVMSDPSQPFADEKPLLAPRGSVAVFNSHTWHGGTLNRSDKPRRAFHSYWTRRHKNQQTDQRKWLSEATKARLSEAHRFLLDVA